MSGAELCRLVKLLTHVESLGKHFLAIRTQTLDIVIVMIVKFDYA